MNEPRAVWELLVQKAERRVQDARLALRQIEAQQAQIQASLQRLQAMTEEYRQRHLRVQEGAHSMQETMDHRRFMDQLGRLSAQVNAQATKTQHQYHQARLEIQAADQELRKSTRLYEVQLGSWRKEQDSREQRRLDDLALRRFTWQEG
jgi:flagellar export protein FliJ